jgi:glutathione S-transferase
MLRIWGRRTSSNVQSVMWTVAELGLAYERYDLGHRFGGLYTPEFLAMNPNGTIPVVRDDDGEPIWESAAIVRYLAGRYGGAPFWPTDPAARAQVDKWAEWSKVNVAGNFSGPIFWRVVRTPASRRDREAIEQAVATLDLYLDIAENQLARHPYLSGDAFTVADVQFGHLLYRYFDIDIDRRARPNLVAYYEGLALRPAYREHVMIPYDDLRAVD